MRTFKLYKKLPYSEVAPTDIYDLADAEHIFSEPEGLGLTRNYTTEKVGDDLFITDSNVELKDVSGQITFSGYSMYDEFISFLSGADELFIEYQTPSQTKPRYAECRLKSIDKRELDDTQKLICKVDFITLSKWFELYHTTETGRRLDYPNNVDYAIGNLDNLLPNIGYKSLIASPFDVQITFTYQMAVVDEPEFTYGIVKISGETREKTIVGKLHRCVFANGEKLLIKSNAKDMGIFSIDTSGNVTSIYQCCYPDITYKHFFKLNDEYKFHLVLDSADDNSTYNFEQWGRVYVDSI